MRRARRHQHEEHLNHEAWAIPYGDLVTLLLAFFVVMYAVSSVNEGKYRVMADAMSAAFGGPPRTLTPVQVGETQPLGSSSDRPAVSTQAAAGAAASPVQSLRMREAFELPTFARQYRPPAARSAAAAKADEQLGAIGTRVEKALSSLVAQGLVTVRRSRSYLEIEIQSDLLFASGVAVPSAAARTTIEQLAAVLREEPNAIRVEGYTDNLPIRTAQFQSNWELSAARAASVVHVLSSVGIAEPRLAVIGYGEHQPIADNTTAQGRNANRRVQLVILAAPQAADTVMPARPPAPGAVAASSTPIASDAVGPAPGAIAATTRTLASNAPATPITAGVH